MATTLQGLRGWSMERDEEGHREYRVRHLVRGSYTDGPATALNTPGLPQYGDPWNFGDDVDLWAFCKRRASVQVHDVKEGEKARYWVVENVFSTKRDKDCREDSIEDPLLQPPKVSGSFVRYSEEYTVDRFGKSLLMSSHEPIRGPQVEFDSNRPQVRIEQNVAFLELDLLSSMINTVNDAPLWGMPPRTVKLSNAPWQKQFYGTCSHYYTRVLEFDIDYSTFDRTVVDEGTKVLHGQWNRITGLWEITDIADDVPADKTNPTHFILYQDKYGNRGKVLLDGNGKPFIPIESQDTDECEFCFPEEGVIGSGDALAKTKYRVQGIDTGSNNDLILTNTGGCTWEGSVDGIDFVLTIEENVDFGNTMRLENQSTLNAWYSTAWSCAGPSTLAPDGATGAEGDVVIHASDEPGSHRIQQYNESNFLLLGIPTVL